jgi:ubiquinone biosynthesis protein Coq4
MLLKNWWRSLSGLWLALRGVIKLLKASDMINAVYDIEDGLKHTRATQLAIADVKSNPEVAKMVQERYLAPSPNVEFLHHCPPGSLGNTYAIHLDQMGLNPNFYRQVVVEDDASYIFLRMRQTHDLWHIVTGFGIDGLGEMELKAFEIAQTRRAMAFVLLGLSVLNGVFKYPEGLGVFFDRITNAYQLGKQAKPFLAQKWEEDWEKPLTLWRSELGLE